MATVNVSISTIYNSEFGTYNTTAPTTINVKQGDTVQFNWTLHDGANQPSDVKIIGLSSATWTSTSRPTMTAPGTNDSRNIRADAVIGVDVVTVLPSDSNFPTKAINITVESSTDTVPDAFDLGSQINNTELFTYVESPIITISGLGVGDGATIYTSDPDGLGGNLYRINSASTWTNSSQLVYNGDTVQCLLRSSTSYNTTRTLTLYIGGVTDNWSVRTRPQPPAKTPVSLGITTPPIGLLNLGDFFGRFNQFSTTILSDYYRGGIYVPNLTVNNGIPTSGNLSLQDFLGSGTEFGWEKLPVNKYASHDSTSSGTTLTLGWSTLEAIITNSDFYVGYGEGIRSVTEYRYSHTGDAEMYIGSGTSWSTSKNQVALRYVVPQGMSEREISGTITFEARFAGVIVTAQCDYQFFIYGS